MDVDLSDKFMEYRLPKFNDVHLKILEENLNIEHSFYERNGIKFNKIQESIISSYEKTGEIVKLLTQESLSIYYQPKVNVREDKCDSFEALIRLTKDDGQVVGPYFLDDLENAGMAPLIDLWVCREVYNDFEKWEWTGFHPNISINIHPDTLENRAIIEYIADKLEGKKISFEVIERGLLEGDNTFKNIEYLHSKGFGIDIDDFGTGYSSLEILCKLPVDCVKFDKSMIEMITDKRGFFVCNYVAEMCKKLDMGCVAEGVERIEQLYLVDRLGIDLVQGYYFSPAIKASSIKNYKPSCKMFNNVHSL